MPQQTCVLSCELLTLLTRAFLSEVSGNEGRIWGYLIHSEHCFMLAPGNGVFLDTPPPQRRELGACVFILCLLVPNHGWGGIPRAKLVLPEGL